MDESLESRMDRVESAMEGLVRSQSQLLRSQVVLTDTVQKLAEVQTVSERRFEDFSRRSEESRLRLEEAQRIGFEKLAETTDKLNALIAFWTTTGGGAAPDSARNGARCPLLFRLHAGEQALHLLPLIERGEALLQALAV